MCGASPRGSRRRPTPCVSGPGTKCAGLATNLRAYINAFSENMREVLEKFDFNNTIVKLDEEGLLYKVMERFKNIDLHPDVVDGGAVGYWD